MMAEMSSSGQGDGVLYGGGAGTLCESEVVSGRIADEGLEGNELARRFTVELFVAVEFSLGKWAYL